MVGIIFLVTVLALFVFMALAAFFIIFGAIKKMKGFMIAGIVMIVLFLLTFVALFLMNMAV